MSNSNFNKNPTHSFDIYLAASIGIQEAILVNYFQYWISLNHRKKKNLIDGRTWMYETREGIADHFPYFTADQVRRLTDKLIDIGILIKGNFNKTSFDRTNWYAFSDESIFLNNSYDWQNCQMDSAEQPNPIGESAKYNNDIVPSPIAKESSKQASSQPATFSYEKKIYSCMVDLPFNDKQKIALCMLDLSEKSEQIVSDAVAKYKQRIAEGYIPENHYGFLQTLILDKDKPIKPKADQVEDNRAMVTSLLSRQDIVYPDSVYIEPLSKHVEIGNGVHQPTYIEYTDPNFKKKFTDGVNKWQIKIKK